MKQAQTIWKAGELALTYSRTQPDGDAVTQSKHVADRLRDAYGDTIEVCETAVVIGLSRANKVRTIFRVSTGGTTGTVIDPKLVFSRLLLDNCSAFVLSHNHPSGSTRPSASDISLTKNFVKAGKVLDIPCLDHLIVTADSYFSFADNRLL